MKRTYENDAVRVYWDSSRCIHVGKCLRADGEVFDIERRPWVDLDAGTTEQVVAAIEQCPSGALRYERLDGGPQEQAEDPATIVPWPSGPLMVRGEVEIRDARDRVFDAGPRFALCRCGHSENHPFCDLSHREHGWRNYPRATSDERETAESPVEITKSPLD